MTPTRWLAILLIALGAAPAQAKAQGGARMVVFPGQGTIKGALAKAPATVTTTVADAARASGARVDLAAGTADDAMTLAGCNQKEPDCLSKVAATLDADLVVVISVAAADTGVFVDIDIGKRGAAEPIRANWLLDGADVAAIQKAAAREAATLFAGDGGTKAAAPAPEPAAGDPAAALPPEETAAPASPAPADDRPGRFSRVRAYSWITAGAGVALIAGGALFLKGAGDKQDAIDNAPADSLDDFRELESLEDEAESQALWGNVLLLTGLAAAGVGATLIVVQMRSGSEEDASIAIAPTAFDRGAGLALTFTGDPL